MRQVSKKQAKINRELKKVYAEIAEEREPICSGCGSGKIPLSHSHLIPRSRRPDLVTCKENIVYHCMDFNGREGCHNIWEHKGGIGLKDYYDNMNILKKLDEQYHYIRLQKWER